MTAKKQPDFEASMARLTEIVTALENGDAPLGESLKLFEEGTALLGRCSALLDEAEQKVEQLRKGPDGAPEALPFGGEDE